MIGLALAIMVIGILFGFAIPWVGIVVGLAGLVLFVALLARFGRRESQSADRRSR